MCIYIPSLKAQLLMQVFPFFMSLTKNQTGWAELLHRFVKGGGSIYDIEFMCDDSGKYKG